MTYSSEVLADSPLAYYRLGDASGTTTVDSSGNARDGFYTSSPTLGVAGALAGDADTAVTFDSTTQRASTGFASWMDVTTAVTLEAWVKTTATSGTIFSRNAVQTPYRIGVSTGKAFIEIRTTGSSTTLLSTGTINDGNWHHIVGTWDSSTMRIYVDGTESANQAKTGTLVTTGGGLNINNRNVDSFLGATIDEASFYGTALSSARIAAHHTAGTTGGGTAASGTGSLSLSASGGVQAAGGGSGALVLAASGSATAPAAGTADLTLSGTGSTSGTLAASGSASLALAGSGAAGADATGMASLALTAAGSGDGSNDAAGAGSLTLTAEGADIAAGTATLELVAAGSAAILYTTDTSNALDGLDITFTGTASVAKAPAPVPPNLVLGERYEVAIPYPQPTMVNGRPT